MDILIEPFAGIAGDMMLAALLDLGLDPAGIEAELRKLDLPEKWSLQVRRVQRHSIGAYQVTFVMDGKPIEGPFLTPPNAAAPKGELRVGAGRPLGGGHGRTFTQISALIEKSALAPGAAARAQKIFRLLGETEAKLHGVAIEEVHFHEVGALDAILDICGVCVALELLGVDRVYTLPLPLGTGSVKTAHGVLPLPAPATLALLMGFPVRRVDLDYELVTPTGAAIVAALAEPAVPFAYTVARVGYGAGAKDDARIANVVRLQLLSDGGLPAAEMITVLETTIDDALPEWIGALLDKLRGNGALDAFAVPVVMKKGRPGTHLTVLARPADAGRLAEICFTDSTTIGIRMRTESRLALKRRAARVATPWGPVDVKVVTLPDGAERATPEHDSCAAVANAAGVSLVDVYRAAAASRDFLA